MASVVPPNSPDNRAADAVIISTIFVAIAGIFVTLRCIARFVLLRICGADDILIILSLAFSSAFTILIHAQKQNGFGKHLDTLTPQQQVQYLKTFWASVIVYYMSLTAVKSSLLCQFLRFLVDRTTRKICWVMLTVVVIYGACTVFGSVSACTPVSSFWEQMNHEGHCINLLAFWFTNASFNIVSDIAIWVLPMPVLKKLQLPPKQKYSLILVFALGGCACIISTIRLYSLYTVAHSSDVSWGNVGAAIWSSIEINVGIICACLPTLKVLVNHCLPRLLHSGSRHHSPAEMRPERTFSVHSVGIDDGTLLMNQIMVHQSYQVDEESVLARPAQVVHALTK